MKRIGIRQALPIAALMTVLGGCTAPVQTETRTATAPEVKMTPAPVKVVRRDIVGLEQLQGQLYTPPEAQAAVLPPYNAPVEKVFVTVGKKVRKGEPLLQLSFPDAQAAYANASAAVKAAESAYASAQAQYGGAYRAARQQVSDARAAVNQARADLANNAGDPASVSNAEGTLASAQASLDQANSEYQVAIQPYAAQVASARAAFREARAGAKLSQVKAPISGTLLTLDVTPGQTVGQNAAKPIATIVDLDDLLVRAPLTAQQEGYIKKGMNVVLQFAKITEQFEGKVINVSTTPVTANKAGQPQVVGYIATISFTNDQGLVKPGATPTVIGVKTGEARNAISVPVSAVGRDDTGKPIVNKLDGDTWKHVVVETGLTDGSYIEIKSGLQVDDTVQSPIQVNSK